MNEKPSLYSLPVRNDCRCLGKVNLLRTSCSNLGISREKAHQVHFRVRKCSLSEYELYSEPVVVSVFLAIIYCLYNSLVPVILKKNVLVLFILIIKKKNCPVSIYPHKNLTFKLSTELIASTCTPKNEILPKKWQNWSEEKFPLIAFP